LQQTHIEAPKRREKRREMTIGIYVSSRVVLTDEQETAWSMEEVVGMNSSIHKKSGMPSLDLCRFQHLFILSA
jgi:hypothetical protein